MNHSDQAQANLKAAQSNSTRKQPNIDWATIDTVLLDMDGTLLDLHFDNYFWLEHLPKRYAEHHQLDEQQSREHLHQQIKAYQGTLQWYCLDHWSTLVQMDIPNLKREIKHKIGMRPHSERFLRFLKQHNKQVILVTNAHRDGLNIKLEESKIAPWLDGIVSSHDYQIPKEAPEFWLQLHAALRFNPQRTLFIDDTPHIVARAAEFGIAHLACITAPDSQVAARPACNYDFLYINDFDQILPINTADEAATKNLDQAQTNDD